MKINSITEAQTINENQSIAEDTVVIVTEVQAMVGDVHRIRKMIKGQTLNEDNAAELNSILDEMYEILDDHIITEIAESVDRQFRRYGDTFLRQYRCTSGAKKGRLVSSPEQCGKRKDPRRVRIGKKAARVKKGIRIRKSAFTRRKTQSKRLSRLNTVLRGDK